MMMNSRKCGWVVTLCLCGVPWGDVAGQDASQDYARLAKALKVRELKTLMFAKYNNVNLMKLEQFLKKYPDAPEREKVLYLKAYSIWSLHRYKEAGPAYATLLKEFPETRFARLARIREAASYLFSGQPALALPRLQKLQKAYPDRPEMYARELAYSLSRVGKQQEAITFMDDVEAELLFRNRERLLPRIKSHFDKIRMVGKPLPAFDVQDHRSGDPINPARLKGKVVLIDFWATWCRPCLAELPYVQAAHRDLAARGFVVFGISLDENQQRMEAMVAKRKMDWLHHYDGKKWKNELAVVFDVHSIPASLLVDRRGIVRAVNLRGKELADVAEGLLREAAQ